MSCKHNTSLTQDSSTVRLCMTHCGFIADAALHHMLVCFALHRYGTLTDPAADDWSAAAVRAALWRVGGRRLARNHRTGERRQTCRGTTRRKWLNYTETMFSAIRAPYCLTFLDYCQYSIYVLVPIAK